LFILVLTALSLALAIPVFGQAPIPPTTAGGGPPGPGTQTAPAGTVRGGALMPDDVFTPISQGYDLIRDGKYEAARNEFGKAVKADRFNPFALNNMAVLEER